ncbi:MAG: hypothetical protein JWP01_2737 [Myxococcales bacterium]|nr:hypothetical protein [Myxococcales bacterium]
MRSIYLVAMVLAAAAVQPASADKRGKQVRYLGIHPVPKSEGGGLCYIEGPHVHIFAANKLEYRDHRNHNTFVGDPVAYGYDGPRHAYRGNHPIRIDAVVGDAEEDLEFCYLDGPHYHSFTPAATIEADFKVSGDAYFYVAEPPPAYIEARPAMIKVNAMYTPIAYTRPVIEVEPPSGWIGVRFAGPAVVVNERPATIVRPGVRAGVAIGAEVHVPMPSLSVNIGIGSPGVIVRDRPVYIKERGRGHGKYKHKKWKHR